MPAVSNSSRWTGDERFLSAATRIADPASDDDRLAIPETIAIGVPGEGIGQMPKSSSPSEMPSPSESQYQGSVK